MRTMEIVMWVSRQQKADLDEAWKSTPGIMNRSQYIRLALNAYSGRKIFDEEGEE